VHLKAEEMQDLVCEGIGSQSWDEIANPLLTDEVSGGEESESGGEDEDTTSGAAEHAEQSIEPPSARGFTYG